MAKSKKNQVVEVKITALNRKGNGIGAFVTEEGGASSGVEVPFAIPGDVVKVRIRGKRSGRYLSFLEEVVEPSPKRLSPRCSHFGQCGGCRWQQLSYDEQLKVKEETVLKAFSPILSGEAKVRPIVACSSQWHYRNKMEFTFSQDSKGGKFLGLIMDSSRGKVLNLNECHLVNPWFLDAVVAARQWWDEIDALAYHMPSDIGSLRTLTLREGMSTGDRMVMLTVSGNPDYSLRRQDLDGFVAFIRDAVQPRTSLSTFSVVLRIQQVAKGMSTNFYEMIIHGTDHIREELSVQIDQSDPPVKLLFHISPTAFFQPNTRQAEKLYSVALQLAKVPKGGVVYDLYCGTGTLGICAATRARQVIGIDISLESALDARANAARNGMENVSILSGAIRHVLGQVRSDANYPKADLVLADPPRPGLDPEAMQNIINLNAEKILYISCNYETQALNVAHILQHGYKITALQPIDQFAHTPHVENIVVLEKE